MRIYATTPSNGEFYDFQQSGAHFFQDSQLRVQTWNDSIELVDITNAMKPGKKCLRVSFQQPWQSTRCEVANLFHKCQGNFKTMFDLLAKVAAPHEYQGTDVELYGFTGKVYVSEREAIRIFSPFATLAPLKETPKKWTLTHVVRAFLNGQYRNLRCNGVYTDDYAYDDASNYQRGEKSALHFAAELVTSPSGWWAHSNASGDVSICCHSFDSNSFEFVLKPAPLTVQQLIDRYALDFSQMRIERHKNGNALLCQYATCTLPLLQLAEAVKKLGATVELETEGQMLYLAIYPTALTSCPA